MNELTLNPGIAALPAGDRQVGEPVVSIPNPRRRVETRARRRLSSRVLQTNDGGFRPFRVY